jgi:predicted alpha/beta-fold hydrolase
VWVVGGHARSFVRGFVQQHLPLHYERETVTLDDGGTVCLDWTTPKNNERSDPPKIVLFLPGLTGGSNENYAKSICHKATELGYTAVVFNNRGCADAPLTTPKLYCAAKTDDFCAVLLLIRSRYPDSPIFLMGISLGGVLITQYLCGLGENGVEPGVIGALCVSSTFDGVVTSKQMEQPMSLLTFNHYLTENLVQLLKRHRDIFKKADDLPFDIDSVLQVKTLGQLDERLIVPMFNYKSRQEYYIDATTSHRLCHISVPYLALNAGDDPFAPEFALPVSQFSSSHYTAMIKTTVGGHIGFSDSLWPSGPTLIEKIFAEYSKACFEHGKELKPMD